jgi:hypothetical protein
MEGTESEGEDSEKGSDLTRKRNPFSTKPWIFAGYPRITGKKENWKRRSRHWIRLIP